MNSDPISVANGLASLCCPVAGCAAVPHMRATAFGHRPATASGPGLVVECFCEELHHWQLVFEDHSGGIWVSAVRLCDLASDPWFNEDCA